MKWNQDAENGPPGIKVWQVLLLDIACARMQSKLLTLLTVVFGGGSKSQG